MILDIENVLTPLIDFVGQCLKVNITNAFKLSIKCKECVDELFKLLDDIVGYYWDKVFSNLFDDIGKAGSRFLIYTSLFNISFSNAYYCIVALLHNALTHVFYSLRVIIESMAFGVYVDNKYLRCRNSKYGSWICVIRCEKEFREKERFSPVGRVKEVLREAFPAYLYNLLTNLLHKTYEITSIFLHATSLLKVREERKFAGMIGNIAKIGLFPGYSLIMPSEYQNGDIELINKPIRVTVKCVRTLLRVMVYTWLCTVACDFASCCSCGLRVNGKVLGEALEEHECYIYQNRENIVRLIEEIEKVENEYFLEIKQSESGKSKKRRTGN